MSFESQEEKIANLFNKNQPAPSQTPPPATAVVETPTEPTPEPTPVVAEAPKEEQAPPKEEVVIEESPTSWDAQEPEVKLTSSVFDFNKIGSALELGEIKDENEFVTKVTELKTLNKQLRENPLQGLPEEFREVIEVTRKSGDWKAFLAEQLTDYTKVDSLQLYEDSYFQAASQLPEFRNPDGTLNVDAVHEAIDTVPKASRIFEGNRIKSGLIQNQQARKAQLNQQAQEKVLQAEKSLGTATKSLNELLPFEEYGIKFEHKHSNQIYEGVTSSKLTKKHLGMTYEDLVRSGADMKAITRTVAAAEYADQMLKFKGKASATQAKREILTKTQNVQIQTPGTTVTPERTEDRQLSSVEKMKQSLDAIKKTQPLR